MFNDNQQRYLLSRLRGIDETLGDALADTASADAGRLFHKTTPDATPGQRQVLAGYVAQVRFAMRRFLLTEQLRSDVRPPGELAVIRTAALFAHIAAEEMGPRFLQGYGDLDPDAAASAERLAAELATLLNRMQGYLERGGDGMLATRLERLAQTREEIALLTELARIIAAHGLTELSGTLETLLEKAAAPSCEIAVFGRVNAGKSSLLNGWLGQPLLPTGVTPVTAFPTRIVSGDRLRVTIARPHGPPLQIAPEVLAQYATERGNPGNRRAVLEIRIQTPSPRLRGGICLLDTPGINSLAAGVAARTLECLPRCDLAILLIEAGAAVTAEDIDVARALIDGGSKLLPVVSKADRLPPRELEEHLAYTREQLESRLGLSVPLRPVSTVTSGQAAAWYDEEIAPRLGRHAEHAANALRRKIAVLRESVMALLASRARPAEGEWAGRGAPPQTLQAAAAQARVDIERTHGELIELRSQLRRYAPAVLEAAAQALAASWLAQAGAEGGGARVEAALVHRMEEVGHMVTSLLESLRGEVAQRLGPGHEVPPPRGRPVFDAGAVVATLAPILPRPAFLPPSRRAAEAFARARLKGAPQDALEAQLTVHGEALLRWGRAYLEEIGRQIDAAVAVIDGLSRLGGSPDEPGGPALLHDLERLQQWPADAA